jgi:hypothetical protein
MPPSEFTLWLWRWLFDHGARWTASEIAQRTGVDSQKIFRALHNMHRNGTVAQFAPAPGDHRKQYGVNGLCLVPKGLTLSEVQG